MVDQENNNYAHWCHNTHTDGETLLVKFIENGTTLPTRHSKSLDQLESQLDHQPHNGSLDHSTQNCHNAIEKLTQSRNYSTDSSLLTDEAKIQRDLHKNETEDLLKNINEFREKYKNPGNGEVGNYCSLSKTPEISTPESIYKKPQALKLDHVLNGSRNKTKEFLSNGVVDKSGSFFNSLPKGSTLGLNRDVATLSTIRSTCAPIKTKQRNNGTHQSNGNCNTLPRSNSTNVLKHRRVQASNKFRNSGENIKHENCNRSNRSINRTPGSSTTSSENDLTRLSTGSPNKAAKRRERRRLLSSASVPFRLEELEKPNKKQSRKQSNHNNNSESLPNLAPPPPEFVTSPFFRPRNHEISRSTSSLSDQSGWVSSRRSSIGQPSSPDSNERILNGAQLRQRLQKLVKEQPSRLQHPQEVNYRKSSVTLK